MSAFSRRRFLEASCTTLGAALGLTLVGCSHSAGALRAVAREGGGFDLPKAALPAPGEALAFAFPDDTPGLLFTRADGSSGAVSATCPHAGCAVNPAAPGQNALFVCPCHGSSFDATGRVLSGPATESLSLFRANASEGEGGVQLAPA